MIGWPQQITPREVMRQFIQGVLMGSCSFSGNCRTGDFTSQFLLWEFALGNQSCCDCVVFLRLRGIASGSYFATYWEVIEPSYDSAAVNCAGKLVGKGVPVMNFSKNILTFSVCSRTQSRWERFWGRRSAKSSPWPTTWALRPSIPDKPLDLPG